MKLVAKKPLNQVQSFTLLFEIQDVQFYAGSIWGTCIFRYMSPKSTRGRRYWDAWFYCENGRRGNPYCVTACMLIDAVCVQPIALPAVVVS